MTKTDKMYSIYANSISMVVLTFLIGGVVPLGGLIGLWSQCREVLRSGNLAGVFYISGLFLISAGFFFSGVYIHIKEGEKYRQPAAIKSLGKSMPGVVVHIMKDDDISGIDNINASTNFVVCFRGDDGKEKYLITPVLPERFDSIPLKEDPTGGRFVTIRQSIDNGCITLDGRCGNEIETGIVTDRNYDGQISCTVYEYEGKYVVDDYNGVPTRKKDIDIASIIFLVGFFVFCFFMLYISFIHR